jgi:S1-C subfamily serine protease
VWVIGAAALLVPGHSRLRQEAQGSEVIRRLNEAMSPRQLLHLLARIDPFPSIAGPMTPGAPPNAAIARELKVAAASRSVVRVLGTACGVGVEGSGWFASSSLVVTAAHVVAGETDTTVVLSGRVLPLHARAVAFDTRNDIAVLRVAGANATPLPLADPVSGAAVAIVGYPQDGPLRFTPGRIGRTQVVLTQDAYGHGPVPRTITAVSGRVQHGDSGAPAIDRAGAVQSTVFAARVGGGGGYGVPGSLVRRALDSARGPVSTGSCAG